MSTLYNNTMYFANSYRYPDNALRGSAVHCLLLLLRASAASEFLRRLKPYILCQEKNYILYVDWCCIYATPQDVVCRAKRGTKCGRRRRIFWPPAGGRGIFATPYMLCYASCSTYTVSCLLVIMCLNTS